MKKSIIRGKILDAAQEVFKRYGYGKCTMDNIARELGKGKSSIYYYFTSKEDIFKAVVENELGLMKTKIREAVAQKETAPEKLKTYVLERMHWVKSLKNLNTILLNEFIVQREFVEHTRRQTDNEEIGLVRSILIEGVSAGIFHLEDSTMSSIAIVTALKGMEIPLLTTDTNDLFEKRLDGLVDVLFFGILKR